MSFAVCAAWLTACSGLAPPSTGPSSSALGEGSPTQSAVAATTLPEPWAALERPIDLPSAQTGECAAAQPRSISKAVGPGAGVGPAYAVGLSPEGKIDFRTVTPTSDGYRYQKVMWLSTGDYSGPVLVRGVRLDDSGVALFRGQDEIGSALLLPESGWATTDGLEAGWRMWLSAIGVSHAGCYLLQVDGTDFTEQIIFQAVT